MQNESAREILLALLRGERIANLPLDTWQLVVKLAMRHGVSELLYHQLTSLEDTLASDRLQTLRKNYLMNAARNSFFYHELANVLASFHRQHIQVIVLKGAFLAEQIYENIATRPMNDIDLLVLENNLMKVDALLMELGYHRQFISLERSDEEHALPYHNAQSGLVIEIHWVLMSAIYGMQADIEQLWQRALPASIAKQTVLRMTPEDQILHLCIHASVHVFQMGLRPLCDINATLQYYQPSIDWDCLHQRAQQWGAARCVYINLRMAQELLHAPVSAEWLNSLRPEEFEEHYYNLALEHLFMSVEAPGEALPGAASLVRFWSTEGPANKLRILARRIFPPRAEMARMYPAPANSVQILLYYPIRFFDLLHRFGQVGLRLIWGDQRTRLRANRQIEINDLRDWMITNRH